MGECVFQDCIFVCMCFLRCVRSVEECEMNMQGSACEDLYGVYKMGMCDLVCRNECVVCGWG